MKYTEALQILKAFAAQQHCHIVRYGSSVWQEEIGNAYLPGTDKDLYIPIQAPSTVIRSIGEELAARLSVNLDGCFHGKTYYQFDLPLDDDDMRLDITIGSPTRYFNFVMGKSLESKELIGTQEQKDDFAEFKDHDLIIGYERGNLKKNIDRAQPDSTEQKKLLKTAACLIKTLVRVYKASANVGKVLKIEEMTARYLHQLIHAHRDGIATQLSTYDQIKIGTPEQAIANILDRCTEAMPEQAALKEARRQVAAKDIELLKEKRKNEGLRITLNTRNEAILAQQKTIAEQTKKLSQQEKTIADQSEQNSALAQRLGEHAAQVQSLQAENQTLQGETQALHALVHEQETELAKYQAEAEKSKWQLRLARALNLFSRDATFELEESALTDPRVCDHQDDTDRLIGASRVFSKINNRLTAEALLSYFKRILEFRYIDDAQLADGGRDEWMQKFFFLIDYYHDLKEQFSEPAIVRIGIIRGILNQLVDFFEMIGPTQRYINTQLFRCTLDALTETKAEFLQNLCSRLTYSDHVKIVIRAHQNRIFDFLQINQKGKITKMSVMEGAISGVFYAILRTQPEEGLNDFDVFHFLAFEKVLFENCSINKLNHPDPDFLSELASRYIAGLIAAKKEYPKQRATEYFFSIFDAHCLKSDEKTLKKQIDFHGACKKIAKDFFTIARDPALSLNLVTQQRVYMASVHTRLVGFPPTVYVDYVYLYHPFLLALLDSAFRKKEINVQKGGKLKELIVELSKQFIEMNYYGWSDEALSNDQQVIQAIQAGLEVFVQAKDNQYQLLDEQSIPFVNARYLATALKHISNKLTGRKLKELSTQECSFSAQHVHVNRLQANCLTLPGGFRIRPNVKPHQQWQAFVSQLFLWRIVHPDFRKACAAATDYIDGERSYQKMDSFFDYINAGAILLPSGELPGDSLSHMVEVIGQFFCELESNVTDWQKRAQETFFKAMVMADACDKIDAWCKFLTSKGIFDILAYKKITQSDIEGVFAGIKAMHHDFFPPSEQETKKTLPELFEAWGQAFAIEVAAIKASGAGVQALYALEQTFALHGAEFQTHTQTQTKMRR